MQHRQRRTLAGGLVFAVAGFAPWAAQADNSWTDGSWYVGAQGGVNFVERQKFDIYNFGLGVQDGSKISEVDFDTGWLAGLNFGYAFANGLRPEIEVGYRSNKFDTLYREPVLLLFTGGESEIGGKETALSYMANLWYDFPLGKHWRPYIGVGIGYSDLKIDASHWDNTNLKSDKDGVLSYQGGIGLAFDYDEHWTTSIDYRYFWTERGQFDVLVNAPDTYIEGDYAAHSVVLGLKYRFGKSAPKEAPPAPPLEVQVVDPVEPPPPAPSPTCEAPSPGEPITLEGCKAGDAIILRGVNFEFDQARLTVDAKTLLNGVADELRRYRGIKVEIAGHTDARGSDIYNQKLSESRAESVRQYLISRGIAPTRITGAQGFGETVPIADNDSDEGREQNRRVELKIVENTPASVEAEAEAAPAAAEAAPAPASAPAAALVAQPAPAPAEEPATVEPAAAAPAAVPVENLPDTGADPIPTESSDPVPVENLPPQ